MEIPAGSGSSAVRPTLAPAIGAHDVLAEPPVPASASSQEAILLRPEREADGVDGLIDETRQQIGRGADFVKVYGDYRWGPDGEARPT